MHEARQKLANAKAESQRKLEEKRQQHHEELKHLDDLLVKPTPAPPPPATAAEIAAKLHAEAAEHERLHQAELRKLDADRVERIHGSLFQACREGNSAGVEAAFKAGAQANWTDSSGSTAMVEAASGGADAVKIISLLNSRGVSLDTGRRGETPIYSAVKHENLPALQELLRIGAKNFGHNKHGLVAMSVAITLSNPEIAKTLIKAGAEVTPKMVNNIKSRAEEDIGFKDVLALVEKPAPAAASTPGAGAPASSTAKLSEL